jgi:hypothetical protein
VAVRTLRTLTLVAFAAGVLVGCGGDDEADATQDPTSSTATSIPVTSTTTGSTTSTAPASVAFPPENEDLTHGGSTWAVVLAGAEASDAPILVQAQAAAEAAGYRTGPTDCDVGAADAVGLGTGPVYTVSVYLRSEADARQALDAFHHAGWDGGAVAEVQTFCMD